MKAVFDTAVELGNVLGVPMAVAFTITCFVLRALLVRMSKNEQELQKLKESYKTELNSLYDRINPMSENIAFIKGWIESRKESE